MSVDRDTSDRRVARIAAAAVLIGCLAAIATDVTTVLIVDDLSFVSNTISNAAAGRLAWIQDTGLCLLGLSLFALAYGLWRTGPGGWRRWLSAGSIIVVGAALIVLALHDEYGDGDRGGWVFHAELVYLIGSAMLIPMAAQASSFDETRRFFKPLSWFLFALWLIGGPLLFQVPDAFKGLYERGLAGIMLAWLLMAALVLLKRSGEDNASGWEGTDLLFRFRT